MLLLGEANADGVEPFLAFAVATDFPRVVDLAIANALNARRVILRVVSRTVGSIIYSFPFGLTLFLRSLRTVRSVKVLAVDEARLEKG
jgi:hypothetical protein